MKIMKVGELVNVIEPYETVDVHRIVDTKYVNLYKGIAVYLKNPDLNYNYRDVLNANVLNVFTYDNGEDEDGDLDCGIRIRVA